MVVPTLAKGDAVSEDALGMTSRLRQRGHDVDIYAERTFLEEPTRPLHELSSNLQRDDICIYHHSIGCDVAVRAIESDRCQRTVIKYHNVTPPSYFRHYADGIALACEAGLEQVNRLCQGNHQFWADSSWNGQELQQHSPKLHWQELPPFHHTSEILRATPAYQSVSGLDDWTRTILVVGRVAPSKNIALAIDSLAEYRRSFDRNTRLIIVGAASIPKYLDELKDRVHEQGQAGHVYITGKVTLAELKAMYLLADVLLVTSLHEGFCVPLLEAMALRIPIVGVPHTAIPQTGGDAVQYVDAEATEIAKALDQLWTESSDREQQILRGRQRYVSQFSIPVLARKFDELFDEVAA